MGMFNAIDTAASGMTAERLRMDTIGNNIANVNTTRTAEGGPYRRQMVVFEQRDSGGMQFGEMLAQQMGKSGTGVRVAGIEKDTSPPRMIYDPSHPDANAQGYVALPNINIVTEMVDMISANRAYEANANMISNAKTMAQKALAMGTSS